jgi:hypothetical protein
MSSLLSNTIFIFIELANKKHIFNLDAFENLNRLKPELIGNIIKSGFASFKIVKNDFTYYSSRGWLSNPIEFLNQYKDAIQQHEFCDEVEFLEEISELSM